LNLFKCVYIEEPCKVFVRKAVLLTSLLTFILLGSTFLSSNIVHSQPQNQNTNQNANRNEKKGAFIDQVNFIHYLDQNLALQDLKAGKIDTYFFNIPLEAVSDMQNDPNLRVYPVPGGFMDLLLNPAPARSSTGELNPFSIKEVRYAMNYLVDRDFVANEILKGYGTARIDPFGLYSPEYLNIIDTVLSFGFRHSPEVAQRMIADALTHVGATKDNNGGGKWIYNGRPITVKILIRQDIPYRKSVGEVIASDLENLGFNVVRDYGDLNKANNIILSSDPQDMKWNIYPEESLASGFAKYSPGTTAQMYAPWSAQMPGNQNPAFWNYKNATLDSITQRISFGNFSSETERNNLLREAVKDGIQESVRVFIATILNQYVASKNVIGLINDFGAGIPGRLSLINGRLADNRPTINVGMKEIYVGAWNNVAGFKDSYGVIERADIVDPGTFVNPYTGEVTSVRTPWTAIQTNGPNGKIPVSADAIIWDPINQRWNKAVNNSTNGNDNNKNDRSTATSKVTYDLKYSKWHNGIMMDKNDLLYASAYFGHEWGTNTGANDKTVDSEYTSQAAQAIKYDKGIRFLSDNKVESYIDFWHFDNKQIGGFAGLWADQPWEITAASERLVTEGKFAFSKTDSTSKGVDWLSFIIPSHANAIKQELQKMKAENYVPNALRGMVSIEEAKKRYDASINWITQHNNAIIGNGPFYLDSYNPSGGIITLKAFRDQSYPFSLGYWSKYEHPKLASIENINNIPRFIRIGQAFNLPLQVNVDGKASNNATINYYFMNSSGNVVLSGAAKPIMNGAAAIGKFVISLTDKDTQKLSVGPNKLQVFAASLDAYKPSVVTKAIVAIRTALR
jgi:peptide/nickel transport system substrate-binding protein